MPVPIFRGTISSGRFMPEQPAFWRMYRDGFEGKQVEVVLRKWRRQRSLPQNSWYWSCIVMGLATETGHTSQEIHEALKHRFLSRIEGKLEITRSTADLTTAEFSEYCERCRVLAAEMGLSITNPGEYE